MLHKEVCALDMDHIWVDDNGWVAPYCSICGKNNPDPNMEVDMEEYE